MEHANLEKKRRKFRQGNNLFFTYTMIGYSGALSLIGWLWDFCTILLFIVIFLYQNVFFYSFAVRKTLGFKKCLVEKNIHHSISTITKFC